MRNEQLANLKKVKKNRDEKKVEEALNKLTEASSNPDSKETNNLLELAVAAAEHRATLGEISSAMEKSFTRYVANNPLLSGVYSNELKMNASFKEARLKADEFAKKEGRRPRIMVAKLGQDGHDRGAKVIATSFADVGFDVDVGPLFQTPEEAAVQAAENDVHVLGISSLAAGHLTLVPAAIKKLREIGRPDIKVVVGGIVPEKDYPALFEHGVLSIFGPGTVIAKAAIEILEKLGLPE